MTTPERHQEQFEDLTVQAHAVRLGMWVFLASEVLLFAGLFALYTAYRADYPAEFRAAYRHNDVWLGSANTAILITSSFTVAWAVHALRRDRRGAALASLAVSIGLGALFLLFKGLEYHEHFAEGIRPGAAYAFAELPARGARIFFTLYYFMTGLHALHMIGGITALGWLAVRIARGRTTAAYHADLEMGALYWHLVDSVWIFLWPLFYLAG